LVPFVKQIVPIVDLPGRTLHIDPPPGGKGGRVGG
jgi:ribosomal 30S subunit maturation factor RimM